MDNTTNDDKKTLVNICEMITLSLVQSNNIIKEMYNITHMLQTSGAKIVEQISHKRMTRTKKKEKNQPITNKRTKERLCTLYFQIHTLQKKAYKQEMFSIWPDNGLVLELLGNLPQKFKQIF